MSTSTLASDSAGVSRIYTAARRVLLDPFTPDLNTIDRRVAQLTAGLLLIGLAGMLIQMVFFGIQPSIMAAFVLASAAYALARTRLFRIAVVLLLLALAAPSFASVVINKAVDRDAFTRP